jgi:hypothetical protein
VRDRRGDRDDTDDADDADDDARDGGDGEALSTSKLFTSSAAAAAMSAYMVEYSTYSLGKIDVHEKRKVNEMAMHMRVCVYALKRACRLTW